MDAEKRENKEISTFEGTLKRAREGNALSQNLLGIWILNSELPDDVEIHEDPFELIRLSAEQGFPTAQYNMGVIHETGYLWVEKDEKQAFEWYRKAANQGCTEAMTSVGWCMYKGIGVEPNLSNALSWLKRQLRVETCVDNFSWRMYMQRMRDALIRTRLYIGSVNSHNMIRSAILN